MKHLVFSLFTEITMTYHLKERKNLFQDHSQPRFPFKKNHRSGTSTSAKKLIFNPTPKSFYFVCNLLCSREKAKKNEYRPVTRKQMRILNLRLDG